ncbi:unnamed protein product [Sphenostylis stenocarpa]|uniref:Uncharacterized protein n=1 Tax=Sphenostylis stenocarpa TaxID=92480 RepID=A0AA86VC74_9FABA|nr:unnamed protein product [Sphenostylis stenocarpa]
MHHAKEDDIDDDDDQILHYDLWMMSSPMSFKGQEAIMHRIKKANRNKEMSEVKIESLSKHSL